MVEQRDAGGGDDDPVASGAAAGGGQRGGVVGVSPLRAISSSTSLLTVRRLRAAVLDASAQSGQREDG